jgi:hypothetical protein
MWYLGGTEISEGGMALYAGVNLEPGDLMESSSKLLFTHD